MCLLLLFMETIGVDTSRWSHLTLFVDHSIGALACFFVNSGNNKRILLVTHLRHAYKCIVNYNESRHRKEQLATRINTIGLQ